MTMLTELQNLQTLVKQLNGKYQQNKKELAELKATPMVAASEMETLKQQQHTFEQNFTDLQSKYDDLAHEMSKLTKHYQEKCAENDVLNEQVTALQAEKTELLAKNEISSQRAQTILERLAALDAAGSEESK